jgi:Leucine-rich repeat (LRR) protein
VKYYLKTRKGDINMSKQSNQRYRKEMEKKDFNNTTTSSKVNNKAASNSVSNAKNNSPDGDYSAPMSTPSERE